MVLWPDLHQPGLVWFKKEPRKCCQQGSDHAGHETARGSSPLTQDNLSKETTTSLSYDTVHPVPHGILPLQHKLLPQDSPGHLLCSGHRAEPGTARTAAAARGEQTPLRQGTLAQCRAFLMAGMKAKQGWAQHFCQG